MPLIAAMDIGASKTHLALLTERAKVLERWKVRTHEGSETPSQRLRQFCLDIKKHLGGSQTLAAVGVAFAGRVDPASGRALPGPNFKWNSATIPLGSMVSLILGVPTHVDNDVHCFTLAEALKGAGRGRRAVVGVAFGTGIGGGMTIDGKLLESVNNTNCEFGHMSIESGITVAYQEAWMPQCGDGFRGHWESLAGARAIKPWYAHFAGSTVGAREIEELYERGDQAAVSTVNVVRHAIAQGLANIITALNPDIIVLGGGLIRMKPLWTNMERLTKKLLPFRVACRLRRSSLGDDAQLIGATLLAPQTLE